MIGIFIDLLARTARINTEFPLESNCVILENDIKSCGPSLSAHTKKQCKMIMTRMLFIISLLDLGLHWVKQQP